jgi:hypothetical protein
MAKELIRLITFLFVIVYCHNLFGQERLVASSADGIADFYIVGKARLVEDDYSHKTYVQVWVKETAAQGKVVEFRNKHIGNLAKYKASTAGHKAISHSLSLWKLDLGKERFMIIEEFAYGTGGSVISNYKFDEEEWNNIVPNSIVATVLAEVRKLILEDAKRIE